MPIKYVTEPECVGCGTCCRNWLVEVDPTDHGTPLELTHVPGDDERFMRQKESGACIALDEEANRCTIYEQRPQVCRDFERLSRDCWKKLRGEGRMEEFVIGGTPAALPV